MSRVVVLTTSWPRFPGDTAGSFVLHWCLGLARRGHSLVVLCPAAPGAPAHEMYPPRSADRGPEASPSGGPDPQIEIHRIDYACSGALFYRAGAPENLAASWRAWLEIPSFLAALVAASIRHTKGADLLVGHWVLPMGLLAATLGRALGVGAAAIAHSGDVHLLSRAPRASWPLLRRLFGGARLACVAPHQRETMNRIGTAEVIPMGVEEELFEVAARRLEARARCQCEGFTVLFMGRLVPIKGLAALVRAAAAIEVTLLLAGDGPERAPLEQLSQRLGVTCIFLGQVSGPARLDAFAAADAFVLPSLILPNARSEGLPVSLLEAAAAGLPCLSSTSGGAADLFTPEEEMLFFTANDEEALRAQLTRLSKDDALRERLGFAARQKARGLRWEVITERYAEFLGLT